VEVEANKKEKQAQTNQQHIKKQAQLPLEMTKSLPFASGTQWLPATIVI
jgi:hypothetical protein